MKRPAFTAVAVLTLALGIGANSTVYTFLNAVLYEPIPFKDYNNTVFLYSANAQLHTTRDLVSVPDFADWRSRSRSFDQLSAVGSDTFTLTGDGPPERLQASYVTATFFPFLQSNAELGRTFLPSEEQSTNSRSAVLSHAFWQRRYGSDPKVIGRTVTLNSIPYTIVGVMPRQVWFPRPETALWLPLAPDGNWSRSSRFLMVFGNLKSGVSIDQARSEMDALSTALSGQFPDSNTSWATNVISLDQALLKDADRAVMRLLITTVMFVLLIACANISNLLLSRGVGRQREIAIRTALGATRLRVIRQLLTESVVLSIAGGLVGLMIAIWGADALMNVIPHRAPPPDTLVNGFIFGITMLLSVASAVLFGLVPAFEVSKSDVNSTLKEGSRGGSGAVRSSRFRSLLVVTEVTLTLILLIGGGLVIRQAAHLLSIDPGFPTKGLLSLEVDLPEAQYKTMEEVGSFYGRALQQLKSVPGVSASAVTTQVPITSDGDNTRFVLRGNEAAPVEERPMGASMRVSEDFFQTLGISIMQGRSFTSQDSSASARVAIVNQTLAQKHLGTGDPIGMSIALSTDAGVSEWMTIVGVAKDLMPANLAQGKRPQIYVPYSQHPRRTMMMIVRTAGDPLSLSGLARDAIWSVDRNLPIDRVATVAELVNDDFRGAFALSYVFGVFGAIALTLAVIGIYGVVAYSAAQRTQEIGIRLALGAGTSDVLRMVIGQGMKLILLGTLIGLAGGFAISRLLSGVLIGVSASDPITFVVATATLLGVALLATYLPARRAMHIDPIVALRHE